MQSLVEQANVAIRNRHKEHEIDHRFSDERTAKYFNNGEHEGIYGKIIRVTTCKPTILQYEESTSTSSYS